MNRPSETTSTVAASPASWTASRTPVLQTYVPSFRVDVTDAAAAKLTNGEADTPGWSLTYNASKPLSSALRATSRKARRSVSVPAWTPNLIGSATTRTVVV